MPHIFSFYAWQVMSKCLEILMFFNIEFSIINTFRVSRDVIVKK